MRLNKIPIRLACIAVVMFVMNLSAASSPLDYKTFVNGSSLWICNPAGILMYRNDTKSARSIVLCDTVDNDSIAEIAENNSQLWALSQSGVYQIDFTTTTVEKLPGGKKGRISDKLAVDDDYVWAALGDTLWRFDKLGREWFAYPMNNGGNRICGMYSNGTNVYCVLPSTVKIFSTKDEKWLEFPDKKDMVISTSARFFLDKNTLVFVDGPIIYRYLVNSQSWDIVTTGSRVVDMLTQDSVVYYLTTSGMFKYATATSVIQPQDIPDVARVRSFGRLSDTLFCATASNVIKYDIRAKTSGNIQQPQNIADYTVLKTILLGPTLIALCPQNIGVYDQSTQFWENIPLASGNRKRKRIVWDDENGLKVNYAKGYDSQLKGSIEKDYIIDSLVSKKDSTILTYTDPVPIVNLTLHSTFSKGRYLDAFFDNSDISQVPRKGLFYRGADSDRIESARLGSNKIDAVQSKTLPASQYEGGSVILQSKTSLSTRDRRFIKAQTGAGLLVTRTVNKVLPYSETGIYEVKGNAAGSAGDTTTIVPGSLKVAIDGDQVDSVDFTLVTHTGILSFNRQDLLDPTSVITVSYQMRTVADSGLQTVEMAPENNYGKIGFASISVSPTDWISPQAGFYYLKTDSLHQMVNVAAPAEVRSSNPALFMKINPELTYDAATKKKAAGLALQSRFGEKLSLLMNGLMPDSGFKTTDNLDRGYGVLKHDADFTAEYDIKKELPVSYYQREIASAGGVEKRYELSAGSHFLGLPFCDLSLSRNVVDVHRVDTITLVRIDSTNILKKDTLRTDSIANDTLDRVKDKFRIHVYETSSPIVESALHLNRLSYDLSYTGFTSQKEHMDGLGYGNVFYGNGTISPTKRLTLSVVGVYLKNPVGSQYSSEYNPTFIVQTIDAPPGVDISARNDVNYKSQVDSGKSSVSVLRIAGLTIKPGTWTRYLNWITPLLGINQSITCAFNDPNPGFGAIVLADKDVLKHSITKSIGANIFPTSDILLHDDNQWTIGDSSTKYYALDDVKWWFGAQRMWQTRWEYDRDRPRFERGLKRDYHRGFTKFTDTWNSWLQTITGISSSYVLTDTSKITSFGPDLSISFNKQKALFFKEFINIHTLKMSWNREHDSISSSPDINYTFYLKIILLPNISVISTDAFAFSNGSFSKYNGTLSAALIF